MKIYLDNNATTPVDPRVVMEMERALKGEFGNPASVAHAWGWQAEELVKIAREKVAKAIGAKTNDIIFTSGATEAINLAILGLRKEKTRRIIHSSIEHKAVIDVCEEMRRSGFEVRIVPVNHLGLIDLDKLRRELNSPTLLVSIIAANNEIGTIQDIKAISKLCKERGALLHLDITQLLGKVKFNLEELGVDLASFSSHKIYGPKGVGALYASTQARDKLQPIIFGGGHERGLRSGTLNVPGIVGFGTAAGILSEELSKIENHVGRLTELMDRELRRQIPEIKLNGDPKNRILGNLNLRIPGINAGQLLAKLGTTIALSSSSACLSQTGGASHVLKAIGLTRQERDESFRIGIGRFNTVEEIGFAAEKIALTAKTI